MVSQNATEEEEEEEDFMSDKFLQDPATTKAGSTAAKTTETYSERRRREVDRAKEQSRILSRAEREKAARKRGLGRSLIEIAEGKGEGREERGANGEVEEEAGKRKRIEQDQGDEEVGQGESKALRMMKAMGYVTGDALGKKDGKAKEDDPESAEGGTERGTSRAEESRDLTAPLAIDERWIGARVRHGIGIVSRSIHEASEKQAAEAARGDLDDFRKRATREHEAKHCEALLRRARKTCEDLDRQQDVEYSPLWLDPQLLYIKKEDLRADRAELIELALDESNEEKESSSAAERPDGEEVDPEQTPSQRRQEAKQFLNLEAKARLDITLSHLRFAHFYCLFCGERYSSQDELQQICPGEDEEDH